ncbi:MAG: hypothetical protein ACLRSW_05970 [Christensenellaceae bacterium]
MRRDTVLSARYGRYICTPAYGGVYEHTATTPKGWQSSVPENLKLCYWDYYHTEAAHYEECIESIAD